MNTTQTTVRYAPGPASGIGGGHIWALVDCVPGDETSLACLSTLQSGGSSDDLLEVLFAGGLKSAPDFAICEMGSAGSFRLLVRGVATAEVTSATGTRLIPGSGLVNDQEMQDLTTVALRMGDPTLPAAVPLPDGLVPAGTIRILLDDHDEQRPVTRPADVDGSAKVRASGLGPVASPSRPPLVPVGREPDSATLAPVPPAGDDAEVEEYVRLFGPGATEVDPSQSPADRALADDTAREHRDDVTEAVTAPPETAQEKATASRSPDVEPPSDAPVQPGENEPSEAGGIAASASFIDSVPDFTRPMPAGSRAASAAVPIGPPPREAPGPPSRVDAGRHAKPPVIGPEGPLPSRDDSPPELSGRTVNRSEILHESESGLGPVVFAARCASGHLSPAFAPSCRVCGGSIPPQEPMEIPRPPLGRLVSSGGDLRLDRDVVVGRDPRVPALQEGGVPHLLRVDDPRMEVSGQHAAVRLDYWNVTVTDLGSTNGTQVVTPDGQRRRLVPGTAVVIEPGTTIVLAEIIELLFEASG